MSSELRATRIRRVVIDRTAVLAVGLATGFLVGASFHPSGRPGGQGTCSQASPQDGIPPAAPNDGVLTLTPTASARIARTGRIRVGVFGDSYGDGLWAALFRRLPKDDGFDVLRFSKQATGFTRYRSVDLEKRATTQLAKGPIDVAVVSFGLNDVQPIYHDGKLHALLGPGWRRIVEERIVRFVAVTRSTGATVFWVGLPVMREGAFDEDVRAMNAFHAGVMRKLGVTYVDTRSASLDRSGGFNRYLPDPKSREPRLMRAGDGIHMTMVGYERLVEPLISRLRTAEHLFGAAAPKEGGDRGQLTPTVDPSRSSVRSEVDRRPRPAPSRTRRAPGRANGRPSDEGPTRETPAPREADTSVGQRSEAPR